MALCLAVNQISLSRVRHDVRRYAHKLSTPPPYACSTTGFILPRQVDTLSKHVLSQTNEYEQSHCSITHIQTHTFENARKCEAISQCWESYSRAHDTTSWHFHNEEILNRHWCNLIICIYIPLKGAIATPSKIGQSWLQKAESFCFSMTLQHLHLPSKFDKSNCKPSIYFNKVI